MISLLSNSSTTSLVLPLVIDLGVTCISITIAIAIGVIVIIPPFTVASRSSARSEEFVVLIRSSNSILVVLVGGLALPGPRPRLRVVALAVRVPLNVLLLPRGKVDPARGCPVRPRGRG